MRVKEKKRKAKKQTEKWIELLPLILILAVLPVVVHLKIVSTGLENYPWFPDESSSLGKMLAAPGQELSFRFGESKKNPVYMAFYNPNYAAICAIEAERCGIFHESCTCFFCSRLSDHGTGK